MQITCCGDDFVEPYERILEAIQRYSEVCRAVIFQNTGAGDPGVQPCTVRRLRSFLQLVRTRLPSHEIGLAARVGGKESDVKKIV